ncbi:hypothetical protein EES37_34455 [Streptomyces sp. ADI91-18]|nr:hypothetical protein EES37_34455 [Streptomyces sp. ADI91-18]
MSPLQMASVPLPVTARVVAVDELTVKVPVWSLSVTHSVFVRPNPAAVSSVFVAGADAARAAGLIPITAVASRTRAMSRSSRGTISVTSSVWPLPSFAVVFSAGLPAGTGVPGVPAKQLAAVRTQKWLTSDPVHARELASSPMVSWTAYGYLPAAASGPVTARAGAAGIRPTAITAAAADRPVIRETRGRSTDMLLPSKVGCGRRGRPRACQGAGRPLGRRSHGEWCKGAARSADGAGRCGT